MTDEKPDLSAFKTTMPWNQRAEMIRERFPSTANLDWKRAFDRDLDLFARVIRDILKLDQAPPSRPGPRPALSFDQGMRRMNQFLGRDYSLLPFDEAFRVLARGRSVRHLATKTGLDRNHIHRLLNGKVEPDIFTMEQVAKAFDKHPSYFLEYRVLTIAHALVTKMEEVPESTIGIYRKIRREQSA